MGGAARLRSIFNASDWGSAKGMYNYSLMNNAKRLLLISHSRPNAATAARTNTCTCTYTLISSTHAQSGRRTENDVTGVSLRKHACMLNGYALTPPGTPESNKEVKRRVKDRCLGDGALIDFTVRRAPRRRSESRALSACHVLDNPQYKSMNY